MIDFLQFRIERDKEHEGQLRTAYIFKDMPCVALAATSAHSMGVHRSWPIARIKEIERLTTRKEDTIEAKKILKQRVTSSFTPILWPNEEALGRNGTHKKERPEFEKLWMPITFHSELKPFVGQAVGKFNKEFQSMFYVFPCYFKRNYQQIGVAWKSGGKRLEHVVR